MLPFPPSGIWLAAFSVLLSYTWIRADSVHVRIRRQQKSCTIEEFQCDNKCISKYAVCDGTPQCKDLMDESPTVCREVSKNCLIPRLAEGTTYNVGDCSRGGGVCGLSPSSAKTVTVSCKTGFLIPYTVNDSTTVVCPSKHWDHHMTKCARCGRSSKTGAPSATGRFDTSLEKYPWHVAIYKIFSGNYYITCGGTLITPHLVVTAANCVFNVDGTTPVPSEYKIVAGKAHHPTNQQDRIQERKVEKIMFRKTFNGDINSYTQNIALIKVESDFNLNSHINVICVHPQLFSIFGVDSVVSIPGWGLSRDKTFDKLKEATYVTTDIKKCRKLSTSVSFDRFFSYDKFCVLYNTGANGFQPVDSGSGIVFSNGAIAYLYGIVSANVATNNKFSIVTNFTKHLDWVKKSINQINSRHVCTNTSFHCDTGSCISKDLICNGIDNCGDGSDEKSTLCPTRGKPNSSGTCVLPEYGQSNIFRQQTCVSDSCNLKSGSVINKGTVVKTTCQKGYAFTDYKLNENPSACLDGLFYPTLSKCTKLCDPLHSTSLEIRCTYKGENVSCNRMMLPDTKAEYSCLFQYRPLDPSTFSGNNVCQQGGLWKNRLPTCISKCGTKSFNSGIPTISFGAPAKEGGYPWHVGLYKRKNNTFEQACGGSLISPYIVITAAHCVYRETTHTKMPEAEYLVAAGKYYRDLSVQEPHMQILNVKTIMIKDSYYGAAAFYADDIAVLVVERSFELNKFVLPVCLDRSQQPISVNAIGTTVGWGYTENNKSSNELLEANLPYLDLSSCRRKYSASNFVPFLTSDKFCVLYVNGTGTQVGDSGGGYTQEIQQLHYIYGITSLKSRDTNEFGVFTRIGAHMPWLTSTIDSIEANSELK